MFLSLNYLDCRSISLDFRTIKATCKGDLKHYLRLLYTSYTHPSYEINKRSLRFICTAKTYGKDDVIKQMKLIAIDLDGTLLNNKGNVSSRTVEVIKAVRAKGHKVILATGRHMKDTFPIAEQLALTDAVVCYNGGLITSISNKKKTIAHSYTASDVYDLTRLLKKWHFEYLIATQDHYYVESQGRLVRQLARKGIQSERINDIRQIESPIFKTSIVGETQRLDHIERYVRYLVPNLQVMRSGEEALDVVSPQAGKGAALRWLANYYETNQKDTISFGNYYNDISMLQFAGLGVAMGNAPKHVKRVADEITGSNEREGVAEFLERMFLHAFAK